MNWLAHVFLSEAHIDFQLGNLLADLVRGDARTSMSDAFIRGAQCHRAIDRFTDSHPIVRQSRARIDPEFRRFSGVLVDIYYDHLLARRWPQYSPVPLTQFTAEFYRQRSAVEPALPPDAAATLRRIRTFDLLGAYVELEGVSASLRRLSDGLQSRWHRSFELHRSVDTFAARLDAFEEDFQAFFPILIAHLDAEWPLAFKR